MSPTSAAKVLIVGGGPTGMALALALKQQGIAAEIREARRRAAVQQDGRILALSHGARQILERLGAWQRLRHCPIETIHVSHRGGFGCTHLHAAELGVPALGYVLSAADLIAALDAELQAQAIPYLDQCKVGAGEAASAALTAWAEGAVDPAAARLRDYGQHAVLCLATIAGRHERRAWERFTAEGPLALLPFSADSKQYAVVLTVAAADVEGVLALDDAGFLRLLQRRFGERHRFVATTPRQSYALGLRWREQPVGERQVWLGNAAQTLHPVAGQGFNLALRDVWEFARHAGAAADPGAAEVLAAYAGAREIDRRGAIGFTDLLIDGFASDFAPLKQLRGLGLLALDVLPPLRNFVARRMMFGARAWP